MELNEAVIPPSIDMVSQLQQLVLSGDVEEFTTGLDEQWNRLARRQALGKDDDK